MGVQIQRRRRDRHLYDGLPLAKSMRVVDRKAIEAARKNYCELCGSFRGPFQVHHVKTRGSGGGDLAELLINLCVGPGTNDCHGKVHRAQRGYRRGDVELRTRSR
jgi:hypothetical protein